MSNLYDLVDQQLTVIDGTKEYLNEPGAHKGIFLIDTTSFELSRDVVSTKRSKLRIVDPEKKVKEYDIIMFRFNGLQRFGRIEKIEHEEDGFSNVDFAYGLDVYNNEIIVPGALSEANFLNLDGLVFNNYQSLSIKLLSDMYIGQYKLTLYSDLSPRRVLGDEFDNCKMTIPDLIKRIRERSILSGNPNMGGYPFGGLKEIHKIEENIVNTNIAFTPYRNITIRYDDPRIYNIIKSKIDINMNTRLTLYDETMTAGFHGIYDAETNRLSIDPTKYQTYQRITPDYQNRVPNIIKVDGDEWGDSSINITGYFGNLEQEKVALIENAYRPCKSIIKKVKPESVKDIEYARAIFMENMDDYEVEITLPYPNTLLDIGHKGENGETIDDLLFSKIKLYLENHKIIDTIVTGYTISNGTIKVILGEYRTRLTDRLNK